METESGLLTWKPADRDGTLATAILRGSSRQVEAILVTDGEAPIAALLAAPGEGRYRTYRSSRLLGGGRVLTAAASKPSGNIDRVSIRHRDGRVDAVVDADGGGSPDYFITEISSSLSIVLVRGDEGGAFEAVLVHDAVASGFVGACDYATNPAEISVLYARAPSAGWTEHVLRSGGRRAYAVARHAEGGNGVERALLDLDGDRFADLLVGAGRDGRVGVRSLARGAAELDPREPLRLARWLASAAAVAVERWREDWPAIEGTGLLGCALPRLHQVPRGKR